jgi:type IV pilus assembly protein PilO
LPEQGEGFLGRNQVGKGFAMSSSLRKLVFFIVLVGVAVVAYQFMIKPVNASLAKHREQVEEKKRKLRELERATAAAKDLSEQLDKLEKAIRYFESKLPPTVEMDKVLQDVTLIAQKEGLQPKTIRTLDSKDNSGYVEQPLKMELVGDFNSFYSFLLELEKLPRIMKIRELDLKKGRDYEGQISANFIVSIFFQNAKS